MILIILDIATLTGAATLGLGRQYAAMYTRNTALAKKLHEYGESSGDRVWHMPLIDDYQVALQSSIADLKHTADKPKFSAGSVTACCFLNTLLANANGCTLILQDLLVVKAISGENPKGGTGFGVRLLIDWIAGLR